MQTAATAYVHVHVIPSAKHMPALPLAQKDSCAAPLDHTHLDRCVTLLSHHLICLCQAVHARRPLFFVTPHTPCTAFLHLGKLSAVCMRASYVYSLPSRSWRSSHHAQQSGTRLAATAKGHSQRRVPMPQQQVHTSLAVCQCHTTAGLHEPCCLLHPQEEGC